MVSRTQLFALLTQLHASAKHKPADNTLNYTCCVLAFIITVQPEDGLCLAETHIFLVNKMVVLYSKFYSSGLIIELVLNLFDGRVYLIS